MSCFRKLRESASKLLLCKRYAPVQKSPCLDQADEARGFLHQFIRRAP